jgi:hypothetical protein
MREPNLKGNNLDSDSEEVDADDDSLARKMGDQSGRD